MLNFSCLPFFHRSSYSLCFNSVERFLDHFPWFVEHLSKGRVQCFFNYDTSLKRSYLHEETKDCKAATIWQVSEEGIVCLLQCILASIIIVALFDMFLKFKQLPKLWVISKIDLVGLFKRFIAFIKTAEAILQAIWVVAFAATAFADVIIGLLVSILFALLTTLMRQQL